MIVYIKGIIDEGKKFENTKVRKVLKVVAVLCYHK